MALTDVLGLEFFEVAYIVLLLFVPYMLATRQMLLFVLCVATLYGCCRAIRKRRSANIDPQDKYLLITGCDSGIGHATAQRMASLGFTVFAGCLSKSSEGAAQLTTMTTPGSITVLQIDVTKEMEIREAFEHVRKQCGNEGLYALLNNAGVFGIGNVEICSVDHYRRVLDVNLLGMIQTTRIFLPLLRKCKGRIINTSSVSGVAYSQNRSAYCISKRAVEAFSDTLRLEMVRFGVNVSIIQPANFGGATSILSSTAMESVRLFLEKMLSDVTEEVHNAYGGNYVDDIMRDLSNIKGNSSKDITPIIDAVVDAVCNETPKIRYLVGDNRAWYDINTIIVAALPYLPDWLKDKILLSLTSQ